MRFYGIKENKCHIDLTERTPEICTIEELGFTVNTNLRTILDNYFGKNCILIYSVSNVTNTRVYPVTVPSNDAAIVIINKVGNFASIEFHFYDSFYTNQYLFNEQSGPRLAGWMQIDSNINLSVYLTKAEATANYATKQQVANHISKITEFKITMDDVPAGETSQFIKDLSNYAVTNMMHAIVTPATLNYMLGFTDNGVRALNYAYCIRNNNFVLRVKNNLSTTMSNLEFNVCII